MTLGQHIQTLRTTAGISPDAFCRQLHISGKTLAKWESDETTPNSGQLVSISRMFQVPIGTLLEIEGIKPPPMDQQVTPSEWTVLEEFFRNRRQPKRLGRTARVLLLTAAALLCLIGLLVFRSR
ncbi:MAG: family transcriptional regulator [Oscillospiraceae bacterium]|nr:family transcriptional regulator [Oscillospiraceae bacterium]